VFLRGRCCHPSFSTILCQTADIHVASADNIKELASDPDLAVLTQKLQASVTPVVKWSSSKKLTIAPGKLQVMLFTPWNKQYHSRSDIRIEGIDVPLNKYLKFLGVTIDPMYTFYYHILDIYAKVCQRLNILHAVSGFAWGHDKKTLITTYKALIESVLSYACAVWFPNAEPTNIQKLQFIQNYAMRLITGCHKAADIDHLHTETKSMPVAAHLNMLCTQFLASCLRTSHPSHDMNKLPPGPRRHAHGRPLKETLSSKFGDAVDPFLHKGIIPGCEYKKAKDDIHTLAVSAAIVAAKPNRVLGTHLPEIHPSERELAQVYQTTLSQLHSEHCSSL
jgi:hypothetical protein